MGRIHEPLSASNWWADRGIVLSSTELNRSTLFGLAAQCWENEEPDWVAFLWHVLAWGVVGDYRNATKIVSSAADAEQRARLNSVLRTAAEASHRGDIRSAYMAIHGKVARLGPAFFSKFLYLTSDRELPGPRCLILDSRVVAAVFTLTGHGYWKETAATYERFCSEVHRWSELFGEPDDVIEFRLYQFGRLIGSSRWRWLHAEASLYREGRQQVGFDDIAERQACLIGWTAD
ncbi:hypothetical protein A5719_01885 [Mycolicibacterium peregrinum]|uniref:8-oxoguanine DNA glycosylase OGG fold protein n=1 Tax=Mycolicibacterium peregrinum TaxID=43304 RepID=UPI0007EBE908|nr:hypothetical protein [Mycolicibacterium peregrinum]OBF43961.1 hypothetical protein A5719_01885 [Mycolicibacterium peregrinum]